jgi:hypothetical protein
MSKHCADCGTKLVGRVCPNCHEELYITDNQLPEFPMSTSEEWDKKVKAQREIIKKKKNENIERF